MRPGIGFVEPYGGPTLAILTEAGDFLAAETGDWLGLEATVPTISVAPIVSPITVVDATVLTTTHGTWTPATDVFSYTYQWQSSPDGSTWSNIGGATAVTYTTPVAIGISYRCNVTAINTFGATTQASNATSAAEGPPTLGLLTEASDILITESSLFLGQE